MFFFSCEFKGTILATLCVKLKRTLVPVKLVAAFVSFVMQTQRFLSLSVVLANERNFILIFEELPVTEGIW